MMEWVIVSRLSFCSLLRELTCCERWTLRFILSAYIFTDDDEPFPPCSLLPSPALLAAS